MEDALITIALTGTSEASQKQVLHGLAAGGHPFLLRRCLSKKQPIKCSPSILLTGPLTKNKPFKTYTYMEQDYLVLDLSAACPSAPCTSVHTPASCMPAAAQSGAAAPALFPLLSCINVAVVVCDSLSLEQGLARLAQLLRLDSVKEKGLPVILCVCCCEEALVRGIWVDYALLEDVLQIPVLPFQSGHPASADDLKAAIAYAWKRPFSYDCLDFSPKKLAAETTHYTKAAYGPLEDKVDRILTTPVAGCCILTLLFFLLSLPALTGAFFLAGPLQEALVSLIVQLSTALSLWKGVFHIPSPFIDLLTHGIVQPLACVLLVLLPPLSVYLPLYFLLEDTGLLPRAVFPVDRLFERCGGCGRQCLTMSLGLCCHQAGIMGCTGGLPPRNNKKSLPLTASSGFCATREEMAALMTTSLLPCSGRMPVLLATAFLFFSGRGTFFSALFLTGLFLTGLLAMGSAAVLCSSFLLAHTGLQRFPSAFSLTLPPIHRPRLWKKMLPAAFDHTCLILGRAASMAVFAGILTQIMANIYIQGTSLLSCCTAALDPIARLLGLDGVILTAFILGAPANEITLPAMVMLYQAQDSLLPMGTLSDLKMLLTANGWTWQTALSVSFFTMFHWPCASTLMTIRQETGRIRWALAAFSLPTLWGMGVCALLNLLFTLS